jgi:hypothetical protein
MKYLQQRSRSDHHMYNIRIRMLIPATPLRIRILTFCVWLDMPDAPATWTKTISTVFPAGWGHPSGTRRAAQ